MATAAVVVGVVLRALQFGTARSLWLDEASLALNIGTRSFGGLLRPLDYNQTAPPAFLWAEKAMTMLGGMNELSLRFVPFAAAVAALFALRRIAFRVLEPVAAAFALLIAAVSPALISYTAEAKPYAVDVLVAVLLVGWTLDVLHDPGDVRTWRRLVGTALVSLFFSTVTPLVVGGAGLTLLTARRVREAERGLRRIVVSGAILGVATVAVYLLFYRAADNGYMNTIWQANFLTPGFPDFFSHLWRTLREMAWWSFGLGSNTWTTDAAQAVLVNYLTAVMAACVIVGAAQLARARGRVTSLLIASPVIMAFAASVARQYPIALRLALFTVPSLILLATAGLGGTITPALRRRWPRVLRFAAAFWIGSVLIYDLRSLPKPRRLADSRTVIRELEARHADGEPVYVFARGLTVWGFYTTNWASPDTARLSWMSRVGGLGGPAFENAAGRGRAVVEQDSEGLDYRYRGRTELIGISTGVQWRAMADFSQPKADSGWAEHEADRIRRAARPTAWLFFTHIIDYAYIDLLDAVRARGGTIVYRGIEQGAAVFRVSFP